GSSPPVTPPSSATGGSSPGSDSPPRAMKRVASALETELARLARLELRRSRTTVEAFPASDTRAVALRGGRRLVDFSSNDYLALARHPALGAAMSACAARTGAGSGASHLITGHGAEHELLEEELAAFTHRERALVFSSGYMANLAVLATLAGRGERVLLDRLSHASLIDGARLSGAELRRYPHADAGAAARLLARDPGRTALLGTDGVFSMDGDLAPLPELSRAARDAGAWLVVDDAHGLGVVGASGRGALEHFGLDAGEVPVLVGTLGKAFGSFGAFVAGGADLIELLIQKARPYIYTTALPQPVAAATRCALELIQTESWRRERLLCLTARFRRQAREAGVPLADSPTPIQPVLFGSAAAALAAQRELEEAGFWVVAIRPPTVPPGSSRLRVTLSAAHTEVEVDELVGRLGWSLGGQLALDLAAALPSGIERLALIATTPRFLAGPDWRCGTAPALLARLERQLREDSGRTVREFLKLQVRGVAPRTASRVLARLKGALAAHGPAQPEALARGLDRLRCGDLRPALPLVRIPALVVSGGLDRITPAAAGRALAAALPKGRYVEFARAAHAP